MLVLCTIVVLTGHNNNNNNNKNNSYISSAFASTQLYGLYDTNEASTGGNSNNLIPILIQDTTVIGYNQINLREQQNHNKDITKHEVKPDETISQIANEYGISIETILWSNHVQSADNIDIGDILIILPIDGILHDIKLNETMDDIASLYEVSEEKILKANDIADKKIIFPGQKIIIPGTSFDSLPKETQHNTDSSLLKKIDGYFIRPSQGILSQQLHGNNAIDIANSCWSPVYAASNGTTSVSVDNGKWNGGYGNFITIKHSNGTTTLYAHLIKTKANYGEYVKQGEVIGYMGSTGYSTGCHVHFEVHGAINNIT